MFNPKIKAANIDSMTLELYQETVEALSRIDRNHIEDELEHFPAYYSYYYGLMVRAKKNLDSANISLESYRSVLKTEIRKGGKKTVDALNDEVNAMNEVVDLYNLVSKNEEIYGLMKGICSTLDHKKDMLVQLSANKRQEIKLHN